MTLLKSRLDKLSSPIILISYGDFIRRPSISLAKVPELPALIEIFFLKLKPFNPLPWRIQVLFLKNILIPNFLSPLIVLKISPDLGKFLILQTPYDCEPINSDLMDILLSPSTFIILLKLLIFFFIYNFNF